MNLVSVHLPRNPSVEDCATALRVIFVLAGPGIFEKACDALPGLPVGDAPNAPPAAPIAPVAPPAPSIESAGFGADDGPVNTDAPAVDSQGMPWDERIHAGTKSTNADGSWKKRRGVQEEVVTRVTAELKARPDADNIPAFLDRRTTGAPAVPPAPVAPPAPVPPAAPPAPAADDSSPTTFAAFMRGAGAYLPGNRITMGEINEICSSLGYASPMEMKNAPDAASLFPMAFEMVKDKAASKAAK